MSDTEQQNEKQLIAHLAGTIDVLARLVNEDLPDTQKMQRLRPLINRAKKHQDVWFERQSQGERVVQ